MWDRQQRRRENDTRWQEIQKIISNFWWRKLSDFRFESDNFFMRKLERIFNKFLGSFARVQKAYIQWWIAFKNCNFQLNLPFFLSITKLFTLGTFFLLFESEMQAEIGKNVGSFQRRRLSMIFFSYLYFSISIDSFISGSIEFE